MDLTSRDNAKATSRLDAEHDAQQFAEPRASLDHAPRERTQRVVACTPDLLLNAPELPTFPDTAWAVEVDLSVLDEVVRLVDRAAQQRQPGKTPFTRPPDLAVRLLEALAAPTPTPLMLDVHSVVVHSSTVQDIERVLGELPGVAALQVARQLGILDAPGHESADRVRGIVNAFHTDAGPTLLEVEAIGLGLGLDADTVRRARYFHDSRLRHLGEGWPAEHVEDWVVRNADRITTGHDADAGDHAYDRARVFADLGAVLDRISESAVDWLYAAALGTAITDRSDAQRALGGHPDLTARRMHALTSGQAGVRSVAARWLAEAPDPGALGRLEHAVRREKDDVAMGALLDALAALGRPVSAYLDRDAMAIQATRTLGRGLPALLHWLDVTTLPRVRWADTGEQLAATTQIWLISQAVKSKPAAPGALLRAICGALDPSDRVGFGDELLRQWLAADLASLLDEPSNARGSIRTAAASRGVLALVAVCGGVASIAAAANYVRIWHGQRASQSKALVMMIEHIDGPAAAEALVTIAYRLNAPSIQTAASAAVDSLARRRGWTLNELADRTVPTGGFDPSGRLVLSYGERSFTAGLRSDLSVELTCPDGGLVNRLPSARVGDDPELVAASKSMLLAARETVSSAAQLAAERLGDALAAQHTWTGEAWSRDLADHPVVSRLAGRLVWVATEGLHRTMFRLLDNGTLTNAADEPVALAAEAIVVLAHTVTVTPQERSSWLVHLADKQVPHLLEQFADPWPDLPAETLAGTQLSTAAGAQHTASSLRAVTGRLGYLRGPIGERGAHHGYARAFLGCSLVARLEVHNNTLIGDHTGTVTLGDLTVLAPTGAISLAEVPPVLLAQLRRDLAVLGGF